MRSLTPKPKSALVVLSLMLASFLSVCRTQASSSSSTTTTVSVAGTDAIFLAGRTDVTIPPPGSAPVGYPLLRGSPPGPVTETFPVQLTSATGASFQFSASGIVSVDTSNNFSAFGPDGTLSEPIDAGSLAGISGYYGPAAGLVGVFLNANDPEFSTPPASPNFANNTNFTTLSPTLGEVFFIGDGLTGTGTGTTQTFFAPTGSTRLFLGIVDAPGNSGPPGGYDDNGGSFAVSVTSTGVPEPASLCVLGMAGVSLLGRRRRVVA